MKFSGRLLLISPIVLIMTTSIAVGQMMENGSEGDMKKCPQMQNMAMMQGMGDMMAGMNHENMSGMHEGTQSSISKMLFNKVKLHLDQEQLEKLRSLDTKTRKEVISKKADIDVLSLDLSLFLDSKDLKMKKIENLVKKISSLEADIRIEEIRAYREAYGLLSLEQQSEYNTIKDKKTCSMMGMDEDTENDQGSAENTKHTPITNETNILNNLGEFHGSEPGLRYECL